MKRRFALSVEEVVCGEWTAFAAVREVALVLPQRAACAGTVQSSLRALGAQNGFAQNPLGRKVPGAAFFAAFQS